MTYDLSDFYIILEKAGNRDIESIEAFWSQDFLEASKIIKEFTGELEKLDHNKIGYLSAFLRLSIGETEVENDLKVKIHSFLLLTFIKWLNEHSEDSFSYVEKIASEFKLCVESEKFYYSALEKAFQKILDSIDTGVNIHSEVFNVLSQLLASVQSSQEIYSTEDYSTIKGSEYFDEILLRLCTSTRWPANHIVPLVHCLCDLTLSSKHLEQILEKIENSWSLLEADAIPPLVYQLLLLSNKGSRPLIISQIIQYFNSFHAESTRKDSTSDDPKQKNPRLDQVEGTVIVHIFEAARNEKELGLHIINLFRGAKLAYLSPFTLGLLLALSRNSTYQPKATEYLKNCILNYFQSRQNYFSFSTMELCFELGDITKLFSELLLSCQHGWDLVILGLIEFLIEILDTQLRVFGKPIAPSKKRPRIDAISPLESAQLLAEEILLKVFKTFEVFQHGIFDQLLSRLDSNTDTTIHHVSLLKKIIGSSLSQLGQIAPKIKNTFPSLTSLPVMTAKAVIEAWSPLLCQNPSFLDMLMMVLKKGLFIKKPNERLVSLSGLLHIFSLAAQGRISNRGLALNEIHPICLEILGILRRCLTQQAEIRLCLYDGFNDIVRVVPSVAPHLTEFLSQQFFKYYNRNLQASSPLYLSDCFNSTINAGGILNEPLPALLSSFITATKAFNELDPNNTSLLRCCKTLSELSSRISSAEAEDFGLGEATSFDQVTQDGLTNNATVSILLGLYENFIYFAELEKNNHVRLSIIAKLIEKHSELFQMVKARALDPRGRPVIKNGISSTSLPLSSTLSLLRLVDLHGTTLSSELKSKTVSYIIEVCAIHVDSAHSENPSGSSEFDLYYDMFSALSSILLIKNDKYPELGQVTIQAGLNCLNKLIDTFLGFDYKFEINFVKVLKTLCPKLSVEEVASFEDVSLWYIGEIMSFENKSCSLVTSIVELICSLLKVLIKKFQTNLSSDYYQQELKHLENKLRQELSYVPKADSNLARAIMRLYLLYGTLKDDMTIFYQFIGCIQMEQGVIGSEDSDDEGENFNDIHSGLGHLVAKNLILSYLSVVFSHIHSRLDKFFWAISYISGHHELDQNIIYLVKRLQSSPIVIEKAICKELSVYIKALGLLVRTTLLGPSIEQLIEVLNHVYKILKQFSQHKLKHGLTRSDSFIPLMELVGENLTRHVFSFLTYTQAISAQALASGPSKKAKKAKQGERLTSRPADKGSTKEIRMLSNLTLNLESFELYLYQLYSKFKIDRKSHFKRSIARDFRIDKEIFLRSPSPEDGLANLKAVEEHIFETEELPQIINDGQNSNEILENSDYPQQTPEADSEPLATHNAEAQTEVELIRSNSDNEIILNGSENEVEISSGNSEAELEVNTRNLEDSEAEKSEDNEALSPPIRRKRKQTALKKAARYSSSIEAESEEDRYDSDMIDDD